MVLNSGWNIKIGCFSIEVYMYVFFVNNELEIKILLGILFLIGNYNVDE